MFFFLPDYGLQPGPVPVPPGPAQPPEPRHHAVQGAALGEPSVPGAAAPGEPSVPGAALPTADPHPPQPQGNQNNMQLMLLH